MSAHFGRQNFVAEKQRLLQATAKLAQFLLLASSVPPQIGAGRTFLVRAQVRLSGKASVKFAP